MHQFWFPRLRAYYKKEYFCGILGAVWNWAISLVTGFTRSQKPYLGVGREGGSLRENVGGHTYMFLI
jgi:hypothetical protein